MKAAIETLGCRVNIYDSEAMSELFSRDGYEIVPFSETADVYVINTCTVTNMGDKKSRQLISKARRQNPEAVICVVGCYSQVASSEIAAMPGVDIVLGSRNKSRVVEFANRSLATGEQLIEVSDISSSHEFEELKIKDYENRTRAFLKIQDGCNRYCTYCMIPYARGGISSKDKELVLEEVRTLGRHGFKEVILSGIHIASYGLDRTVPREDTEETGAQADNRSILLPKRKPDGLIELLEDIEGIPDIERVRIGSIEPMFFQGDGLARIKTLKKLAPHFHLSLQSGSDSVLKRMNRRYTTLEFHEVVEKLRRNIPEVSLTTDIITGFPGETEKEHQETMEFLTKLKLTKTHIFKYSPREGTKAAAMTDQISPELKDRRSQELQHLSDTNEAAFHRALLGKTVEVLFEGGGGEFRRGFTPNYVEVVIESNENLKGQILPVFITETLVHECRGILANLVNE